MAAHPVGLGGGAPIHPDQAGMQRFAGSIHRDTGAAVQAADAQGRDRRRRDALRVCLPHAAGDAGLHRLQPDLWPLLGPQRTRRIRLIARAVLGDDPAAGVRQQRLGALGADVDADHVLHVVSCSV